MFSTCCKLHKINCLPPSTLFTTNFYLLAFISRRGLLYCAPPTKKSLLRSRSQPTPIHPAPKKLIFKLCIFFKVPFKENKNNNEKDGIRYNKQNAGFHLWVIYFTLPPPCLFQRWGWGVGRKDNIHVAFYSCTSFAALLDRSGSRAPLIDFSPYIVLWYNFSRLRIIVFFLPAFRAPSLSCCHWVLIPTFYNWRCSTFGQRCGGSSGDRSWHLLHQFIFYCSSIYCRCNSLLIVISPPCRVFWYLKFFS